MIPEVSTTNLRCGTAVTSSEHACKLHRAVALVVVLELACCRDLGLDASLSVCGWDQREKLQGHSSSNHVHVLSSRVRLEDGSCERRIQPGKHACAGLHWGHSRASVLCSQKEEATAG